MISFLLVWGSALTTCSAELTTPPAGPHLQVAQHADATIAGDLSIDPWLTAFLVAHKFMLAAGIEPQDLANNIHYLAQGNIWPMWTCVYGDGTVVYNKFRWYRDGAAVTRYFFGKPDRHDRDAFYYVGERRVRWDTRLAEQFAAQHGGVSSITPIE